jgi:hypothetical protein
MLRALSTRYDIQSLLQLSLPFRSFSIAVVISQAGCIQRACSACGCELLHFVMRIIVVVVVVAAVVADKLIRCPLRSIRHQDFITAGSCIFTSFFWFSLALFPGCLCRA